MQEEKIKLAILESNYGGAITGVNDLVTGFDGPQFEVIFLYLRKKGPRQNHLEQQGFKTLFLSEEKSLRTFHLSALIKLISVLKRRDIAMLHCHCPQAYCVRCPGRCFFA
jgi:hypothetical protein